MPFKFFHEKQYTTGFILFHPQLITKKKKNQEGKKNRRQEEKKNRLRERDLFM